jgi:hypothetical protein
MEGARGTIFFNGGGTGHRLFYWRGHGAQSFLMEGEQGKIFFIGGGTGHHNFYIFDGWGTGHGRGAHRQASFCWEGGIRKNLFCVRVVAENIHIFIFFSLEASSCPMSAIFISYQ